MQWNEPPPVRARARAGRSPRARETGSAAPSSANAAARLVVDRSDHRAVGDDEVHVRGRERRRRPRPSTRPGEGMRTTVSAAPARVASCRPARRAAVVVDRGVGVVRAEGHRAGDHARARRSGPGCRRGRRCGRSAGPRPARAPCARRARRSAPPRPRPRVQPRLRLGLSRHWRVVSTVPSPSWSSAPPSSTKSWRAERRAGRGGDLLGDRLVALQHVLAAPAVEAEAAAASAVAFDEDRAGVAQPDVAERARARSRPPRRRPAGRARPSRPPRRRPCSRTRSPPGPGQRARQRRDLGLRGRRDRPPRARRGWGNPATSPDAATIRRDRRDHAAVLARRREIGEVGEIGDTYRRYGRASSPGA